MTCSVAVLHAISRAVKSVRRDISAIRPRTIRKKRTRNEQSALSNAIIPWNSAFHMYLCSSAQNWLFHEAMQKCLQHNMALLLGDSLWKYLKIRSLTVTKLRKII